MCEQLMEKLHSQLPQPLRRCNPPRHDDLLTQIKNGNSPGTNRSPGLRPVTSSSGNIRARGGGATLASKQVEVNSRSPDTTASATRRPKCGGTASPSRRGKISGQQQAIVEPAAVSDTKQSPVKSLAARPQPPLKTKSAQLRTLRSAQDSNCHNQDGGSVPPWAHNQPTCSGIISTIKKSLSPKFERRKEPDSMEEEEERKNGGGGSPIYHELDPPGTCRFAVQHTYQSIVEISDELNSLRLATDGQALPAADLCRAKSAQELTQKSPTKPSLFTRFRFAAKKSASGKGKGERATHEVRGQRSLQDVDLIARSRDEVDVESGHDRQPSFSTFSQRKTAAAATCDADGYSSIYVPQKSPDRLFSVPVPLRSSSLLPGSNTPASEPLYRQKFLKIASVHTLPSPPFVEDDRRPTLTSSNSVGDLLLTTDVGQPSPRRVTSYDDNAVATSGSRKMAAAMRRQRSQLASCGLSPGRCASSFSSPSCGIRMAEMRGAVRRCTTDGSMSPSRSPSASTPVSSPAGLSVFQFSVPPPGVMMSPPVQRAFRHVSSQTVMSVRPPSASCVLTIAAVHGPAGQMQTIEEEEDDSANDDVSQLNRTALQDGGDNYRRTASHPVEGSETNRDATQLNGTTVDQNNPQKVASGDEQACCDMVAGQRPTHEPADGQLPDRGHPVVPKTSKLRRPAAKPLPQGTRSPLLDQPHLSRIVPPSVSIHRRAESASVSPPSTPRSLDSRSPLAGSGLPSRADVMRRQITRGQQQQRKPAAPLADSDATAPGAGGDGLLVSAAPKGGARRQSEGWGSQSSTSGSSLSLLSTGSEVEAPTGTTAAESKHSTVASRVGKLTIPTHRADHVSY